VSDFIFPCMEYFLTHCVSQPSLLHSRTPSNCESATIPHKHPFKASSIFSGMHFHLERPVSSNVISSTTTWVLFVAITALLTVQVLEVVSNSNPGTVHYGSTMYLSFAIRTYGISIGIKNRFLNNLSVTCK